MSSEAIFLLSKSFFASHFVILHEAMDPQTENPEPIPQLNQHKPGIPVEYENFVVLCGQVECSGLLVWHSVFGV